MYIILYIIGININRKIESIRKEIIKRLKKKDVIIMYIRCIIIIKWKYEKLINNKIIIISINRNNIIIKFK